MKKLYVFLSALLLVVSTWAIAEDAELLDSYLEDLPSGSSTQSIETQPIDTGTTYVPSTDIVVDDNGTQYRRVETADGSELYEEVPVHSATPTNVYTSDVVIHNEVEVQNHVENHQDLEIIELEPEQGDYVVIEAPIDASGNQTSHSVATTSTNDNRASISGHAFCQQNPYARECLLSKYLSLCKKDPQSTDCKSELHKFDRFCGTFPRAYKCKKAKIAASCKQNPGTSECKTFTQRYCQKYPKAIFCNYN